MNGIGIDLNGLCDVSMHTVDGEIFRGGRVPSVIVLSRDASRGVSVIAGEEAASAIEGRGWQWPENARISDDGRSFRIPVASVLEALAKGTEVATPLDPPHNYIAARDLLGATIESLGGSGVRASDSHVVIAVPDDGTFTDEVQQELINAAASKGIRATLLWRPVAAVLALEKLLRPFAGQLRGENIGILSLMDDGIHVSSVIMDVRDRGAEAPYLVPVRKKPGISVPYKTSICELGRAIARDEMPDDPEGAWQILWGDGLVLRWLLKQKDQRSLVQKATGWTLLPGNRPENMRHVVIGDDSIEKIKTFLGDTKYLIFEGPALEAPTSELDLVFYIKNLLSKPGRQVLTFAQMKQHLAARGCVAYATRKQNGQITYLDYLPQIRLAVRRGTEPEFVSLLNPDESQRVVEGGEFYQATRELGTAIPAGTRELKFFVLREGAAIPRFASIDFPKSPREDLPVSVSVRQRPAQGFAQLTIEPTHRRSGFSTIELRWDRMEIRHGQTTDDIIEELRNGGTQIPPVIPQPCHSVVWTHQRSGQSLCDVVSDLDQILRSSADSSALLEAIRILASHLTTFASPSFLSYGESPQRERCRAVSSDGTLPDDLASEPGTTLDGVLSDLGAMLADEKTDRKILSAIVRATSWAFMRCPSEVRLYLTHNAQAGTVRNPAVDFYAMGRAFSSEDECRAFFSVLASTLIPNNSIKNYQLNGLFCILSIRNDAVRWMTHDEADIFLERTRSRLYEQIDMLLPKLSVLTRICLKTMAALLRFRMIDPGFAAPERTDIGHRCVATLQATIEVCRSVDRPDIEKLADDAREWFYGAGDPDILVWDDE